MLEPVALGDQFRKIAAGHDEPSVLFLLQRDGVLESLHDLPHKSPTVNVEPKYSV
jgi:hypothetical protein